jgi:hypothetical protein
MGETNEYGMLENGYLGDSEGDGKIILRWILWK